MKYLKYERKNPLPYYLVIVFSLILSDKREGKIMALLDEQN